MTNIWLFVRKIVLVAACVSAAVADAQFLKSDTWAVTDALGRKALQDPDLDKAIADGKFNLAVQEYDLDNKDMLGD